MCLSLDLHSGNRSFERHTTVVSVEKDRGIERPHSKIDRGCKRPVSKVKKQIKKAFKK